MNWWRRLFHRHDWYCAWFMGNVWTECAICGKRRMIPFEALADIPPGYPIESEFRPRLIKAKLEGDYLQ